MQELNDKYRMYGIVPYNISPIQQGIQFGHGVVEYMVEHDGEFDCDDWARECKTFIILNGGTTNKSVDYKGTMNQHLEAFKELGVNYATFYEPDLGNQLTALVFIVPEEVYNKKEFPDFWNYEPAVKAFKEYGTPRRMLDFKFGEITYEDFDDAEKEAYNQWEEMMGGTVNVLLRQFTSQFRLA